MYRALEYLKQDESPSHKRTSWRLAVGTGLIYLLLQLYNHQFTDGFGALIFMSVLAVGLGAIAGAITPFTRYEQWHFIQRQLTVILIGYGVAALTLFWMVLWFIPILPALLVLVLAYLLLHVLCTWAGLLLAQGVRHWIGLIVQH